ncbi:MAG TPA: VWA domain-containing protein, partial [Gemmatimonadaceae bacterium]|nr:VWA domain-containing protein [Gemmatimonadaceae bacterium]
TKLAYAERLTAALALLLLRQRDAVGLVRFDDRIRTAIPPRARNGQWRRVVAALDDPGSGRASSAPDALQQAARLLSRRGMIVLISDLLMDLPDVERAMRGLRAAGHDVTVMHIMDPAERELPMSGEALFVDTESDLAVPASVADVRAAYKNTVEEVIGEWRAMFGSLGIGYEVIATDAPFGVPLRRAFAARQLLP